jgi:hypothetical protein
VRPPSSVAAFNNEQEIKSVNKLGFGEVEVDVAGACHMRAVWRNEGRVWVL